ncbi:MAG: hypothetical protein NC921_04075 [Candidatus Omnitrophica bacterium]|nr:hypothetical protein [Candidatus Omnitrophota bacterium]
MIRELLSFIFGGLTLLIILWLKNRKSDTRIKKLRDVLNLIEEIIQANKEFINEPWAKFRKRIITYIEEKFHFDLEDELWNYIFLLLYEKYKEIRDAMNEVGEN